MCDPNVAWINEVIDSSDRLNVVTEYLPNGSLHALVKQNQMGIPITQARQYLRGILSALHYFHNIEKVFHMNIKP